MTTLTLAKLAEIETAATKGDTALRLSNYCDPQTILALVRIARVAALSARSPVHYWELLAKTVRDAGLLE